MISIEKLAENRYRVMVEVAKKALHTVTIQPVSYQRLAGPEHSYEELLRASFEFLLEHEPNTSILSEFDLMDINRSFPEYEHVIKSRLDWFSSRC